MARELLEEPEISGERVHMLVTSAVVVSGESRKRTETSLVAAQ